MKNKTHVGLVGAVLTTLLIPVISFAQEAPIEVMDVWIIDAREASEPFPPLFDRFVEAYKKYDSPSERSLWFNTFAGAQGGVIVVSVRWPSIVAFAENTLDTSPEVVALSQEFRQKGFKVRSRSLMYRGR